MTSMCQLGFCRRLYSDGGVRGAKYHWLPQPPPLAVGRRKINPER